MGLNPAIGMESPPPDYVPCPNNCGRWCPTSRVQAMCWKCWDAFKVSLDWFEEKDRDIHPDWAPAHPEIRA